LGASSTKEKETWFEDISKTIEELHNIDETRHKSRKNSKSSSSLESIDSPSLSSITKSSGSRYLTVGSTSSTAIRNSLEDKESSSPIGGEEGMLRSWKKASTAASLDVQRELEDEKKKRVALEEWKETTEKEIDSLKKQLENLSRNIDGDKKESLNIKRELQDIKEKLVNSTMELMQFKDVENPSSPSKSDTPNSIRSSHSEHVTPTRSWNKKLVVDMQEVSKQYNNEKKIRRELEQWKIENEAKMEEMKKKVQREADERVRLEGEYQKLEKEAILLKSKQIVN